MQNHENSQRIIDQHLSGDERVVVYNIGFVSKYSVVVITVKLNSCKNKH